MREREKKKGKKERRKKRMREGKKKSAGRKVWDFLWHSNSIWSWLADLIIIFIIVKFIIFPFFGLVLGTSLPFVIIESNSMEHEAEFDTWFQMHGAWYLNNLDDISKADIEHWSWNNGLDKGDIIVVRGLRNGQYDIGSVIIFSVAGRGTPIIHRVVEVDEEKGVVVYSTKGDHNDGQLPYEQKIAAEQIIGRAAIRIPKAGWIKLFFVKALR